MHFTSTSVNKVWFKQTIKLPQLFKASLEEATGSIIRVLLPAVTGATLGCMCFCPVSLGGPGQESGRAAQKLQCLRRGKAAPLRNAVSCYLLTPLPDAPPFSWAIICTLITRCRTLARHPGADSRQRGLCLPSSHTLQLSGTLNLAGL